jgi:hypothetical protein
MSKTLSRHNENRWRIVPANILVRNMVRPTRMLAGTGIFKGVIMNGALARRDETTWMSCREDGVSGVSRSSILPTENPCRFIGVVHVN